LTDKKKTFFFSTADGDEGGRHHLISAAVSSGTLFVQHSVTGDKRWFKGARVGAERALTSFRVS